MQHIRLELDDAVPARLLDLPAMPRNDVTWHVGDRQGSLCLAGVAGTARLFADPGRMSLVWWPERRLNDADLRRCRDELRGFG